ncbi:hypothetical protein Tco_0250907 [Tanacetum coccineum]
MEISTVIEEQDPTWMTPIIEFISKGTLPHEHKIKGCRRIAARAEIQNFEMVSSIDRFVPNTTMAPMRRGLFWQTMCSARFYGVSAVCTLGPRSL